MSPPHDDMTARFNAMASAALTADAMSRQIFGREAQEAMNLVGPLARRAINIGRALLQPSAVVTPPPQPHCPARGVDLASDPAPSGPDRQPLPPSSGEQPPSGNVTLREAREVWEREWITARLRDFKGNVKATAAAIGMERVALLRKIRQLGIPVTREPGWHSRSRKSQQFSVDN
jgi:hypothetical protein